MNTANIAVAYLAGGASVAVGSLPSVRRRIPRLPNALWLAIGLTAGAAFAPVAAQATGSALTEIVGPSHTPAVVSPANRLLTSEASPASTRGYHFFADSALCTKVMTTPTGGGYILKQAQVDTYNDPTPGSGDAVEIWIGGCYGFPLASIHAGSVGLSTFTFDPGQALAPGTSLFAYASGNIAAQVWLQGYVVPKAAVTVSSPY